MPILWSVPPQKIGLREPSASNLGTINVLMPLIPSGASGSREHKVDNIVREIVLSKRNPDFRSGEFIVIPKWLCAGRQES